ncbi:27607_t:CDS:2, partial [Racocetra persica]
LFLKSAKPVKKDELGDRKCQEFLTKEHLKEILAISLITMQTT